MKMNIMNDSKYWFNDAKQLHREGGLPAIEYSNGDKCWYVNGLAHRDDDLPATELVNGYKEWYVNGIIHRENDLPAAEDINGNKWWYVNGKLHRKGNSPAVETENGNFWYKNDELHREGGLPAIEYSNGDKEWWVNGVNITTIQKKYLEARRIRAEKRIYFWIIPRLYRPGSASAKRLAEASWRTTSFLIEGTYGNHLLLLKRHISELRLKRINIIVNVR